MLGIVLDVWICRVHVHEARDVIPSGQTITQPITTEPPRTWSVRKEQEQCNNAAYSNLSTHTIKLLVHITQCCPGNSSSLRL